jgi:Spore coat protein Z.
MCNNIDNESCRCIAEILGVINILQQNACTSETCLDTCDRGFLGCGVNSLNCNTRPVMLYLSNGMPLSMPTTKENVTSGIEGRTSSDVFRVEKLEGCCCTFRVLEENREGCEFLYSATNSFFTMNLNCCCVLRCLSDTYVECI